MIRQIINDERKAKFYSRWRKSDPFITFDVGLYPTKYADDEIYLFGEE